MIKYKKHGLRMAECWLDTDFAMPSDCDLIFLQQYSKVPPRAFSERFSTLIVNLTLSEGDLLGNLNEKTRYEVRRAGNKDLVECTHEPFANEDVCTEFQQFYNKFAQSKGLGQLLTNQLLARAKAGALQLSRAVYQGQTIVWHVHVITPTTVSLLYSASQFHILAQRDARAAIGRANRLLHWKDMLFFKSQGKDFYDFGGWYSGLENEALLKINQFKEEFGGKRTDQLNAGVPISWRGWIYLMLREHLSADRRKVMVEKVASFVQRK